MSPWTTRFTFDHLPPLVSHRNPAIAYFARKDLLDDDVGSIEQVWRLEQARRILRRQRSDGSWPYSSVNAQVRSQTNYDQLETYRQLGYLVEKYGFTSNHEAIRDSAEYFFQCQSNEGDFRGIYGNQYSPNYTAGITELLVKAGYGEDARIRRTYEWLLSVRQIDGGWAIPFRTRGMNLTALKEAQLIRGDATKPSSHLITGVVLRALAAHKQLRQTEQARAAGRLLADRFFKPDTYLDRQSPSFWTKFSYPFWFTDLISSLDSLSMLGFSAEEPQIKRAIDWLLSRQRSDGLWDISLLKIGDKDLRFWLALVICRVMKRFYE